MRAALDADARPGRSSSGARHDRDDGFRPGSSPTGSTRPGAPRARPRRRGPRPHERDPPAAGVVEPRKVAPHGSTSARGTLAPPGSAWPAHRAPGSSRSSRLSILAIGSRQPRVPPPFGPARNGEFVSSADGDIYLVDPVTHGSSPLIAGPTSTSALCSPATGRGSRSFAGDRPTAAARLRADRWWLPTPTARASASSRPACRCSTAPTGHPTVRGSPSSRPPKMGRVMAWPSSTRMAVACGRSTSPDRSTCRHGFLPKAARSSSAESNCRTMLRRRGSSPSAPTVPGCARSRRDRRSTPTTTRTSACRRTAPASAIGATTVRRPVPVPCAGPVEPGQTGSAPVPGRGPQSGRLLAGRPSVLYPAGARGQPRAHRRGAPSADGSSHRQGNRSRGAPGCRRPALNGSALLARRRGRRSPLDVEKQARLLPIDGSPASDLRPWRAGLPGLPAPRTLRLRAPAHGSLRFGRAHPRRTRHVRRGASAREMLRSRNSGTNPVACLAIDRRARPLAAPAPRGRMQRELVERARRGDHDAFAALAAAAISRLDAAARLILRDPDQAKDAVQEALVRAWRDLPTLRDPGPVRRLAPSPARPCLHR